MSWSVSWTCFLSLNPLKKQEITDKKVAKRIPFRKWFLQNSFVNNGLGVQEKEQNEVC